MYKTVTHKEVLDAIRQNGLEFWQGSYFRAGTEQVGSPDCVPKTDKINAACAIGQAAINLGVRPKSLEMALGYLGYRIIRVNDSSETTSFAEVADKVERSAEYDPEKSVLVTAYDYSDKVQA